MRIAVLAWRDVCHPEAGGSETYVHEVARRWVAGGHDVEVLTSRPGGLAAADVVDGVRHRRAGSRGTVFPRSLQRLAWDRARYDVVLEVVNGVPFGSPLVRRGSVVTLVHHVHREDWFAIYPDLRGRVGWFVESQVMPRIYRRTPLVTVSTASRADLLRLGYRPENLHVVRGGVGVEPLAALPVSQRGPRVCVLARLVPQKQIEHAMRAVADLRAGIPDIRLDIVGSGWWRPQLEHASVALGIVDQTTFHGHLPDRERDEVLAASAVLVLPSLKEGWGLAVTEAAVQGTPTVGYRTSGGLTESVIDGRTGWLADDEEGLRRALTLALSSPDRDVISAAARAKAMELTWDATARKLLAVLTEASRRTAQRSP